MDVARTFLDRSRQYLVREYPTKIQRCLDVLPADALWRRDDASENSVGNLLLHLSGNVRQWIVSGVGGAPDARRRSAEFDAREGGRRVGAHGRSARDATRGRRGARVARRAGRSARLAGSRVAM